MKFQISNLSPQADILPSTDIMNREVAVLTRPISNNKSETKTWWSLDLKIFFKRKQTAYKRFRARSNTTLFWGGWTHYGTWLPRKRKRWRAIWTDLTVTKDVKSFWKSMKGFYNYLNDTSPCWDPRRNLDYLGSPPCLTILDIPQFFSPSRKTS